MNTKQLRKILEDSMVKVNYLKKDLEKIKKSLEGELNTFSEEEQK